MFNITVSDLRLQRFFVASSMSIFIKYTAYSDLPLEATGIAGCPGNIEFHLKLLVRITRALQVWQIFVHVVRIRIFKHSRCYDLPSLILLLTT